MTTIPEAIEKHWRNHHTLYCADCGYVRWLYSHNLEMVRRQFDAAWKQHLEEKHSERKP